MEAKQQLISQFQGLTGTDAETSRYLLESNNWNVEAAIGAFFDGGARGAPQPRPTPTPNASFPPQQQPTNTAMGKIATISSDVDELERKRGVLAGAIDELPTAPRQDTKKRADALRKSCLLSIEELMRRLETLDGLSVGGEEGARAARKELVNRIQRVMGSYDELKDKRLPAVLASL